MKIKKVLIISGISVVSVFLAANVIGANIALKAFSKLKLKKDYAWNEVPCEKKYNEDTEIGRKRAARNEENFNFMKEKSTIISTQSHDNLKLNALFACHENPTNKYVIAMHGYRDDPSVISTQASHFFDYGWNVLIPGQRGHGWSEGDCIDMGSSACHDVITWAKLIHSIDGNARIVIFGVSMGAATVTMATGLDDLPDYVVACIEDCGYTSIWDQVCYRSRIEYHIPPFPLVYATSIMSKIRHGYSFTEYSPLEAVKKSKTPTLFIHGSQDTYVPTYMCHELYDAAVCPKDIIHIAGAEHAEASFVDEDTYWTAVDQFLSKYIEDGL